MELKAEQFAIQRAIEQSSFEKLAAQEQENGFRERSVKAERFFRSGKAGIWRDTLSAEQADQIMQDHHQVMRRFGYIDESGSPYFS